MIGHENPLVSITSLSPQKQLAFALLVLERMLPSLITFAKDTDFDASCYLEAKKAAWEALQTSTVDEALNQVCMESAPDTENFSHDLTSYALNAALAMSDILEFALDGRTDHIKQVLTLARDSIYLYLSSVDSSVVSSREKENRIAEHPLMQQEQRREEHDIAFLSGLSDRFDSDVISALKERANTQPPLLPLTGS
jgi:uncharacterized protein